VNLVAVICVVRVWWKTRRPFLIYLIGAICALTLGGSLFLTSDPWEGRWWTAHLGMLVSAIAVTEGVVAERSRRGRLSEVLDLGYHYLATLFTDVTERMHAEKALRDSEERYRSLVEVSPDAVILMELEGTIRLCNRRAAALQGYESGEELLNKNFFDLVAPDDRERALANAMRIVQEGGVRDVEDQM